MYDGIWGYGGAFKEKDIPDLSGKTAIVTGGNTGIGYEICLTLVKKNATVFIACRSSDRFQAAASKIEKETGKSVTFLQLDLQDLKQVKSAAGIFVNRAMPLDILINNAGIMMHPFSLSKDGIETQFATNHVGHFVKIQLNSSFSQKN